MVRLRPPVAESEGGLLAHAQEHFLKNMTEHRDEEAMAKMLSDAERIKGVTPKEALEIILQRLLKLHPNNQSLIQAAEDRREKQQPTEYKSKGLPV